MAVRPMMAVAAALVAGAAPVVVDPAVLRPINLFQRNTIQL